MTSNKLKQTKQKTVSFRCNESEYRKIDKIAKQEGKNHSRYITDKLLKEEPDYTELYLLLRTVSEAYYKSTGDRQFQARTEKILDKGGF